MSSPVKKILSVSLLTGVSVIFSLGLTETALRIKNASMRNYDIEMWKYARTLKTPSSNPKLGHTHLPNRTETLQSVEIRTNEMGLRGGPVRHPAPQRRVLLLGSSITLGWGVPEAETVAARLQAMFQRQGEDVEVLNAGIGNYNAERYVELFATKLKDLNPTDVVVQFFLRDAEKLESGRTNWFLKHSQLAVTGWNIAHRLIPSGVAAGLEAHYAQVFDDNSEGFKIMLQSLEKLASYCRQEKIATYLAMTPDVHNLKSYPFLPIHQKMQTISTQLGYRYIDLFPGLRGLDNTQVWSMPGDPHPNGFAHGKMAEAIFPLLQPNPRSIAATEKR